MAEHLPIAGRTPPAPARGRQPRGKAERVPAFAEPGLSPDGKEIAFVSGGDIWTVPTPGGEARLLVSHPANESRPLFSPDGKQLAFMSDRSGNPNLYTVTLDTGEVRRVTYDDGRDQLDGWSPDGKYLYFSSSHQDLGGTSDVFRVKAEGGTPMPVTADRFTSEYFGAPSPDGSALAFSARGTGVTQWWRNGHSHLDEAQIWLMKEGRGCEALTPGGSKDLWPMWSPDGRELYFVSDRSGAENVWVRSTSDDTLRQLTHFEAGRVLWPNLSLDGKTLVFERDSRIFALDTESGLSHPVSVARRGAPAGPGVEHLALQGGFEQLALAPDGNKVAFVVHGEVFAASAREGGSARPVTRSAAEETELLWAPDSQRLVYVSDRDGTRHLYQYDFGNGQERRLTSSDQGDANPSFSPDGKSLAFVRGGRELRRLDLATGEEHVLAQGRFGEPPFHFTRGLAWSPDSRWIACRTIDDGSFNQLSVVPAEGGTSRPVTFLANTLGGSVSWSPDGTFLLLDTGQGREPGHIARVDLRSPSPSFREAAFDALFKPAAQTPPPPTEIEFEGIRGRERLLNIPVDAGPPILSPDGKSVVFVGAAAGQTNLFLYPLEGDDPKLRQLTSTAGPKANPQWSPDGKEVYYTDEGAIQAVPVAGGDARKLEITAELDVDFEKEKQEVFQQASSSRLQKGHHRPRKKLSTSGPRDQSSLAPTISPSWFESEKLGACAPSRKTLS